MKEYKEVENELKIGLKLKRNPNGEKIKGNNFMTPDIVGYTTVAGLNVEVSYGTGFNGEWIYGVTIFDDTGNQLPYTDYSKAFYSVDKIKEYLKQLKTTELQEV